MAGNNFSLINGKKFDYVMLIDEDGNEVNGSHPTAVEIQNVNPNGTVTGTTAAAYAEALELTDINGAFLNITNLDPAKTMYYKIDGYLSDNAACIARVIQAETSIAAATTIELPASGVAEGLNGPFARVVVSVKNNSGACAYQVDHIAY